MFSPIPTLRTPPSGDLSFRKAIGPATIATGGWIRPRSRRPTAPLSRADTAEPTVTG